MFTQHAGCNGAAAKLTRWAELVSRLVLKLVEFVIKYFFVVVLSCVFKSCELVGT